MAIRKKAGEKLDEATLNRVSALLNQDNPITKKEACEMLNISYNTTRLGKILDDFNEVAFYENQSVGFSSLSESSSDSCFEPSLDSGDGFLEITTCDGLRTLLLIVYPLTNWLMIVFSSCSLDSSLVNTS